MARIRSIKPAFFRHRGLFQLERTSGLPIRVAFAGLWTAADRDGRFRWQPDELKLDCLPYDDVDFAAVLKALQSAGFVRRYAVTGKDYGWIPSWAEHQVVNSREAQSVLPAPSLDHSDTAITGNYHGEGNGREEERKGTVHSPEALTRSVPADESPIVLTFPTVGPDGPDWRLRHVQVEEWQGTFPTLDVLAECRKAVAWVRANPGRRKTGRGMPKFLVSWLSRAVDSGRGTPRAPEPASSAPASDVDWWEECKQLHGGACEERLRHHHRVQIDKARAS